MSDTASGILTGGEASDYGGVDSLMIMPVPKPAALLADKGYGGDRFREGLLLSNILPVIPSRWSRRVPEHPDCRRYRDRNRAERMFGFLKQQCASPRASRKPRYPTSPTSPSSTSPQQGSC
jgi:hypothetical protein